MRANKGGIFFLCIRRPVARLRSVRFRGWLGLRACFNVDAGASILMRHAAGRPGSEGGNRPTRRPKVAASPILWVARPVQRVHDEIGKNSPDNPHTKMALMHGSNGVHLRELPRGRQSARGWREAIPPRSSIRLKPSSQGSGCQVLAAAGAPALYVRHMPRPT